MKTGPYQALQSLRRIARELRALDERYEGSKQSQAEMKGACLSVARLEKTLQTEVNARKKLRELYEANLKALKAEES